jgi:hypothetical protein
MWKKQKTKWPGDREKRRIDLHHTPRGSFENAKKPPPPSAQFFYFLRACWAILCQP